MWLFLVFTYWIAVALLGQIRYLGPATSTCCCRRFSVSFMIMCAVLDRGGLLVRRCFFPVFDADRPRWSALGVLYLLSIVMVLGVASFADAGALMQWVLSGQEPSVEACATAAFRARCWSRPWPRPRADGFLVCARARRMDRIGAAQSLFYSFFRRIAELARILRLWGRSRVGRGGLPCGGHRRAFLMQGEVQVLHSLH